MTLYRACVVLCNIDQNGELMALYRACIGPCNIDQNRVN